ncbi:hypothetical protein G6F56_005759 [Rhizopus delemar]|nr:hypothetical protein G6F56_005759 [Rhizopus delemar]
MPQKWFKIINQTVDPLKVDGFAARHNTKLKTFWSYQPDPDAEAMDAFYQIWPKKDSILVMKLKEMVLATLWWPTQYWFPVSATNETSSGSSDFQDKKGLDSSRMTLISNKWSTDGVNEETQDFFFKGT